MGSVPIPERKPVTTTQYDNIFKGLSDMVPIPSITGGASGPATSGGVGTQGNIGPVTLSVGSGGKGVSPFLLIGIAALAGVMLWKKK